MPTYQYSCTECHRALEQFQSFSDDALTVCPECGGRLRKVFNAVGVVFKGSGFYRTDSRAGSSATVPAGSSDGGSSSDRSGPEKSSGTSSGSEKSAPKGDAKPAAAATPAAAKD